MNTKLNNAIINQENKSLLQLSKELELLNFMLLYAITDKEINELAIAKIGLCKLIKKTLEKKPSKNNNLEKTLIKSKNKSKKYLTNKES